MADESAESVAGALIACIPQAERVHAIRGLATGLHDHSDIIIPGIIASFIDGTPDEESRAALRTFVRKGITTGNSQSVVELCSSHHNLGDWLLLQILSELQIAAKLLSNASEEKSFVIESAKLSAYIEDNRSQASEDKDIDTSVRKAHEGLSFLLSFFRSSGTSQRSFTPAHSVQSIIPYLFAVDLGLNKLARDALFELLRSSVVSSLPNGSQEAEVLYSSLWSCIKLLLQDGQRNIETSNASQIWLRWLDLHPPRQMLECLFNSEHYWYEIQRLLIAGDFERRKAALHILRKSVALALDDGLDISCVHMYLPSDKKARIRVQYEYERLCVVYETFILARYINQIRECIKDLDVLASEKTTVQRSWLYALLMPALAPAMADGIQKLAGTWLMCSKLSVDKHPRMFSRLLSDYLLPWATQGPHFTSSISRSTSEVRCDHGLRLATFLRGLLRSYSGLEDTESRGILANTIIEYLNTKKNAFISHASVYILEGLVTGLEDEASHCLREADLKALIDIARVTGYQEVVRDLVAVQCSQILEWYRSSLSAMTETSYPVSAINSRLAAIKSHLDVLKSKNLSPTDAPLAEDARSAPGYWRTLDELERDLRTTHCSCLQGSGLVNACTSLINILNSRSSDHTIALCLLNLLESIWTEVEIQDRPKVALQLLPNLYLHPQCLKLAASSDELLTLVRDFVEDFKKIVHGRIYLWSPFTRALRRALFLDLQLAHRLPIEDLIVDVVNRPPSAKPEFQLDAAAASILAGKGADFSHLTYKHYYGEPEVLGYAAFFDIISSPVAIPSDISSRILDRLLEPWIYQKIPAPMVNKWKTTEQLQVMLLLLERRMARSTIEDGQVFMTTLLKMLGHEPLPRYRFLLEWMVSRIVFRYTGLSQQLYHAITIKDHFANPRALASSIKLCVSIACFDNMSEDFAIKVASVLVSLSASSKSIIRHEGQWRFPILFAHAATKGWTSITQNPAFVSLVEQIRSLDVFHEPPLDRRLERLDPIKDHSLANLLSGHYLRLEPPGVQRVSLDEFEKLSALDNDTVSNSTLTSAHRERCIPLGQKPGPVPILQGRENAGPGDQTSEAALSALQTKGTAYLDGLVTDSAGAVGRSPDLIVVGSLISNAYNLGGLSRVSEIFGAASLQVSNPSSVLSNKDFVSVAVSSQNSLPIEALSEADLLAYLSKKKSEGYQIVGIEQTDRSLILGQEGTQLSKKTVLVLGAEKEGMPAYMMGACDLLVEIPQRGITRSLNVQTAAAAVLYEYSRQHHG